MSRANVLDAAAQLFEKFPMIISHRDKDVLGQPPSSGTNSAEHNVEQPDVWAKRSANLIHDSLLVVSFNGWHMVVPTVEYLRVDLEHLRLNLKPLSLR